MSKASRSDPITAWLRTRDSSRSRGVWRTSRGRSPEASERTRRRDHRDWVGCRLGWLARMARDSWVVAAIERAAPRQPATFAAWGLAISEAPYPSALGPLDTPPDPGVAPTGQKLTPAVDAMVRGSTVKVTGNACGL